MAQVPKVPASGAPGEGEGRHCLVTGAYGFIGSAVAMALSRRGWTVVGAGRDVARGRRLLLAIDWVEADFNADLEPEPWRERLRGYDTVVNCVGILQSGRGDSARRIHVEAPAALIRGAEDAGVRRFIHLSAMSAEEEIEGEYSETKRETERLVSASGLDWLIVKPSLVIGPGSYGGTSMIRGLAGLPLVTPLPGGGAQVFQPITMGDLAEGMARLAEPGAPSRTTLYAPGPELKTLADVVARTRTWLGFAPARQMSVPMGLIRPMLRLGDAWVWLGNRTSLCTTSFRHMAYDEVIDPAPFTAATGLEPTTLEEAFAATPATLQDRLHARVLWPGFALRLLMALIWIVSASVMFSPAYVEATIAGVGDAGLGTSIEFFVRVGETLVQGIGGVMFFFDRAVRPAGRMMIAVHLFAMAAIVMVNLLQPVLALIALIAGASKIALVAVVMALAEER